MRKTYVALGMALVIAAAATVGVVAAARAAANRRQTRVITNGVERIARLVTVEYHVSAHVLKIKDAAFYERRGGAWFATVSGKVKGSVDLRRAKIDVSRGSGDKRVRIAFASDAVKVSNPEVAPGVIDCRTIRNPNLFHRVTDEDTNRAQDEALKRMKEAAMEHGIKERTMERAEVFLREFLSPLGYRLEITY